jgi:hypothetical protein
VNPRNRVHCKPGDACRGCDRCRPRRQPDPLITERGAVSLVRREIEHFQQLVAETLFSTAEAAMHNTETIEHLLAVLKNRTGRDYTVDHQPGAGCRLELTERPGSYLGPRLSRPLLKLWLSAYLDGFEQGQRHE